MELARVELERHWRRWLWRSAEGEELCSGRRFLCHQWLEEAFEFPPDITTGELVVHNKPTPDAWRITFRYSDSKYGESWRHDWHWHNCPANDDYATSLYPGFAWMLDELAPCGEITLWLEFWYYEPPQEGGA